MTLINPSLPWNASERPLREGVALVITYLACAYIAANVVVPALLPGGWNLYVAQPLVCLGLGALCLHLEPGLMRRPRPLLLALALLAGLFEIGVFALAGLVYGFGYSTYAHGLLPLFANLAYLACWLWGLEMARAYLLGRWQQRGLPGLLTIALLFVAMGLSLSQLEALASGGRPAFETGGSVFLPAAVESLLATLLVAAGGPWAGVVYRGAPLLAEWLSPVLPQLDWTVRALFGLLAPGLALLALGPALSAGDGEDALPQRGVPSWLLALGATVVAVIWLNTGLLGVRPALVSGLSMEPNYQLGDVIITRPVDAASLQTGDVIRFQSGGVSVVHRIIAVQQTPGGLVFQTKGDNNNFVDPPVAAGAIEGKVVLRLPKLGLPPITLRNWLYAVTS
jgi:signal peptidase